MIIKAKLPIQATATFTIQKPPYWDSLTDEGKAIYFLETAEPDGHLCSSCQKDVVTDFEMAAGKAVRALDVRDFWEVGGPS